MRTSANGIKLIKKYEGYRKMPYFCPAGKLTVGYGHLVLPGENFDNGLTKEEAHDLLVNKDLPPREKALARHVKVPVTQNQVDALMSWVYNFNAQKLAGSTLLKRLNERNYAAAADQFNLWVWAYDPKTKKKKKLDGLIKRRKEESELFMKKELPGNDALRKNATQEQKNIQKQIKEMEKDPRNKGIEDVSKDDSK